LDNQELDKLNAEFLTTNFLNSETAFAKQVPNFVVRPSQSAMADFVHKIIQSNRNGIVEAGTGTGKTFAYLLPALSSKQKIIISTGTKNLQDQLFYQDLPLVNQFHKLKIAILKGRANYLCPKRLEENISILSENVNDKILSDLVNIKAWSKQTKNGDLTEVLDDNNSLIPLVTSTSENCLGRECQFITRCPIYQARDRAQSADVVVVNHHLLFSDLVLDNDRKMGLLPNADLIIIDEAHQLPSTARQFYGESLSSSQFIDFVEDVRKEQTILGKDDPELAASLDRLSQLVERLENHIIQSNEDLNSLLKNLIIIEAIDELDMALGTVLHRLDLVKMRSPGLLNCSRRAVRLLDLLMLITTRQSSESVYWVERRHKRFVLYLTPLSVATELASVFSQPGKRWIFVSATLSVAGSFEHIKAKLGLKNIFEGQFESPFNYLRQVKAYVPKDLPPTGNDHHTKALLSAVLPIIRVNHGRTFFLFTSHRALKLTAGLLQNEFDITFLMQGALPKKRLLEKFIQLERCVLLATHSFWEGVDVRGADLNCLIIDKLPFDSPASPVVSAQLKAIDLNGGNGFNEYSLPEAAISLKQGFGRLIRQESDRGLFVLGDRRINERTYGKMLRQSLPEMDWLASESDALTFVEELFVKDLGAL